MNLEQLQEAYAHLLEQKNALEMRVLKSEAWRRALMHILSDLNTTTRKLADQRKAMIHILADYEQDRSRLAKQTERLDNSRRALMHILQDSHQSNLRLENSRKAMIHIMSDLKETTAEVQRREQELREKQEQLVQAGKLATLGELTTGVAHELNNPLNNIGLFIGNVIDQIELGMADDPGLVLERGGQRRARGQGDQRPRKGKDDQRAPCMTGDGTSHAILRNYPRTARRGPRWLRTVPRPGSEHQQWH